MRGENYDMLSRDDLKTYKIQPVGDGMIDLICPIENVVAFIDFCSTRSIQIKGFTWWCHVTDKHEPCGMGGPKSIYFDGWFSEIQMDTLISFDTNEDYRNYLMTEWKNSSDYKECYWPAFWLE